MCLRYVSSVFQFDYKNKVVILKLELFYEI